MSNIFITGGAGFIGSHLADKLIDNGHRVYVVDDMSTGRIDNIKHLLNHDNFTLKIGNILDEYLMEDVISKCDQIYHLAASVGVKYIMQNRLKSLETNITGTEIILKIASKYKKKIIIASSSEIYGKNNKLPFSECDDMILGAVTLHRWGYACSKAMDEFLSLAYWHDKKLPVIIVRFFNIFGPRQVGGYGMVIPRFIESALSGANLSVYNNGNQTRCFTYIDDAVEAIIALSKHPSAVGEIFNVGNNHEIKIKELADTIIDLTSSHSKIEYIAYKDVYGEGFEDMMRRVPNITKIHKVINWIPKVTLQEGLMKSIEYISNLLKREFYYVEKSRYCLSENSTEGN